MGVHTRPRDVWVSERRVLCRPIVLCSRTRRSIDLLKENFKDALKKEDWQVVIKLKALLNIQ